MSLSPNIAKIILSKKMLGQNHEIPHLKIPVIVNLEYPLPHPKWVYMLQVNFDSRLNFFNKGCFSFSIVSWG